MLERRSPDAGSQSALLALEDGIRRIRDARAVMAFAAEHLARHLGADRVCYAEMDKAGRRFALQVEHTSGRMRSARTSATRCVAATRSAVPTPWRSRD
jgi:hypothetical protein